MLLILFVDAKNPPLGCAAVLLRPSPIVTTQPQPPTQLTPRLRLPLPRDFPPRPRLRAPAVPTPTPNSSHPPVSCRPLAFATELETIPYINWWHRALGGSSSPILFSFPAQKHRGSTARIQQRCPRLARLCPLAHFTAREHFVVFALRPIQRSLHRHSARLV